ncbi:MAG: CRISPR-associated RAMP protein Csx7 [Thermodesulfobacteriota bacterium]
MNQTSFRQKVRITATLIFETAFHIGSGKEGDLATDMGVLKDNQGLPVLPGSTLKGCFRATAEKLAGYLGFSACMLDSELSGEKCVGDQGYFRKVNDEFKEIKTEKGKIVWLRDHTCDVCRLFGSPLQASRIFFSDGTLKKWVGGYQVRDGVAIDRDSGTARDGLKYDFEVAHHDTEFEVVIEMENPERTELALVAAVLAEWQSGFRLGGFTSRGLGRVVMTDAKVEQVDYEDSNQLREYLLKRRMQPADNLLDNALLQALSQ